MTELMLNAEKTQTDVKDLLTNGSQKIELLKNTDDQMALQEVIQPTIKSLSNGFANISNQKECESSFILDDVEDNCSLKLRLSDDEDDLDAEFADKIDNKLDEKEPIDDKQDEKEAVLNTGATISSDNQLIDKTSSDNQLVDKTALQETTQKDNVLQDNTNLDCKEKPTTNGEDLKESTEQEVDKIEDTVSNTDPKQSEDLNKSELSELEDGILGSNERLVLSETDDTLSEHTDKLELSDLEEPQISANNTNSHTNQEEEVSEDNEILKNNEKDLNEEVISKPEKDKEINSIDDTLKELEVELSSSKKSDESKTVEEVETTNSEVPAMSVTDVLHDIDNVLNEPITSISDEKSTESKEQDNLEIESENKLEKENSIENKNDSEDLLIAIAAVPEDQLDQNSYENSSEHSEENSDSNAMDQDLMSDSETVDDNQSEIMVSEPVSLRETPDHTFNIDENSLGLELTNVRGGDEDSSTQNFDHSDIESNLVSDTNLDSDKNLENNSSDVISKEREVNKEVANDNESKNKDSSLETGKSENIDTVSKVLTEDSSVIPAALNMDLAAPNLDSSTATTSLTTDTNAVTTSPTTDTSTVTTSLTADISAVTTSLTADTSTVTTSLTADTNTVTTSLTADTSTVTTAPSEDLSTALNEEVSATIETQSEDLAMETTALNSSEGSTMVSTPNEDLSTDTIDATSSEHLDSVTKSMSDETSKVTETATAPIKDLNTVTTTANGNSGTIVTSVTTDDQEMENFDATETSTSLFTSAILMSINSGNGEDAVGQHIDSESHQEPDVSTPVDTNPDEAPSSTEITDTIETNKRKLDDVDTENFNSLKKIKTTENEAKLDKPVILDISGNVKVALDTKDDIKDEKKGKIKRYDMLLKILPYLYENEQEQRMNVEEFILTKVVEAISRRCELSTLRKKSQEQETIIESLRKKCVHLQKQLEDICTVTNRLQVDLLSKDRPVAPVKITRSVGLQVSLAPPSGVKRVSSCSTNNNNSNVPRKRINSVPSPINQPTPQVTNNNRTVVTNKVTTPTKQPVPEMPILNKMLNKTPTKSVENQKKDASDKPVIDLTDEDDTNKTAPTATTKSNNVVVANQTLPSLIPFSTSNIRMVPGTIATSNATAAGGTQRVTYLMAATPGSGNNRQIFVATSAPSVGGPRPLVANVRPQQVNTRYVTLNPSGQAVLQKPSIMLTNGQRLPLRITNSANRNMTTAVARTTTVQASNMHPAALPIMLNQPHVPGWRDIPPRPTLKITRTPDGGIQLSWNMLDLDHKKHEDVVSYQLYAYQEGNAPPSTDLWRKVGDVKALPLPMACTLTSFQSGNKYYFAVRAIDKHSRYSQFSYAQPISLLNN